MENGPPDEVAGAQDEAVRLFTVVSMAAGDEAIILSSQAY